VGYHDGIEAKLACARLLREEAGSAGTSWSMTYLAAGPARTG
jgi:hypothetical protein